jgi:large subunit ribosomal protein L17
MVIRQQVSDVIAYDKIQTTFTKAKETQRHVDRIITLAKKNSLDGQRKILSIIKDTTSMDKIAICKKLKQLATKYQSRKGGYTRVLRLGKRAGDNTEAAILELV